MRAYADEHSTEHHAVGGNKRNINPKHLVNQWLCGADQDGHKLHQQCDNNNESDYSKISQRKRYQHIRIDEVPNARSQSHHKQCGSSEAKRADKALASSQEGAKAKELRDHDIIYENGRE